MVHAKRVTQMPKDRHLDIRMGAYDKGILADGFWKAEALIASEDVRESKFGVMLE